MKLFLIFTFFLTITQCQARLDPILEIDSKISLSKCVVEASKRFFSRSFDTIVFTLPIKRSYGNFLNTFTGRTLRDLQSSMRWNILVKDLNLISYTFSRITKSYSYIIQIKTDTEFDDSIKKLKSLPSWNPQAKFLVVSTTTLENPDVIANKITTTLWKFNVINGAVLLATKEDDTNYTVYSWFPYSKENCGNKYHVTQIVNHCSMGKIQTKRSWFENKLPRRMHNCTIKANYVNWPPYVINGQSGFRNSNYFYTQGLDMNLLNMVAGNFRFNVDYTESYVWGMISQNGSSTGALSLLSNDSVDILLGGFSTSYLRSIYLDMTRPYLQEAFVWCVPHSPTLIGLNNMINVIEVRVWATLGVVYFLTSGSVWYLSKDNDRETVSYRYLPNALLNSFAIIIGLSSAFLPKTFKSRYLIALLIILGFYMSVFYNTYLTSIKARPRYVEKYTTMKDIYKHKLKTYFMTNAIRYFQDDDGDRNINGVPISLVREKWLDCKNSTVCMRYVAKRKDSAYFVAKNYVDYLLSKDSCPVYCIKKNGVTFPIVLIMRKGFPLFKLIDRQTNAVAEAGFVAKWSRDLLGRGDIKNLHQEDGNVDRLSIKFEDFRPAFFMLIIGFCVSLVAFVLEIVTFNTTLGEKYLDILGIQTRKG